MDAPTAPTVPAVSRRESSEEALATECETLLWTCKECYVYQIPPLKNESGHRANDWDVNKWLWSGQLRVTALGETLKIALLEPSGELFAMCPVTEQKSKAVDPVVDSSRYYVLRVDDGKGRHAFIGMGFRDRSESYDFNATVQDHWKGVERQKEADAMRAQMEARLASEPMRDLSLKDGEKLSLKVNGLRKTDKPAKTRTPTAVGTAGGLLPPPPGPGLLAPPPRAVVPASTDVATSAAPAPAVGTADADDFGDFGEFNDTSDDFGEFGDFATAASSTEDVPPAPPSPKQQSSPQPPAPPSPTQQNGPPAQGCVDGGETPVLCEEDDEEL